MKVQKLFELIPSGVLEELALTTAVDHYAKKLQGEVLFKLLVYCIITYKDNSLRTMQSAYESVTFQLFNPPSVSQTLSYSSISERLSSVRVEFFEGLFERCVLLYQQSIQRNEALKIKRFDSTIVSLSSKLLHTGYRLSGDAQNRSQLKFTIGYGDIPEVVCFFHDIKYTSENAALREAIMQDKALHDGAVRLFDKGVTARSIYDELSEQNIAFVSRLSTVSNVELVCKNPLQTPKKTRSCKILSDGWYYLFGCQHKKTSHPFRIIRAVRLTDNVPLLFITNLRDFSAVDITELYKRRWDIEVFIRFVKQFLGFNHLINRSENGIRVMLYTTMIAAILLFAYKKANGLTGFKLVRQKFAQQLELDILQKLITLCGGNPKKIKDIFRLNSS
jgi:Transposase DDE domain